MAKIKGITVILIDKVQDGVDGFDHPIYKEVEKPIENVLVSPVTSDDVISTTNLYGKKAVYVLGIPKGDKNQWEDRTVKFFDQTFKTFGKATQGIDNLVPLDWNKKVWVEVYE